MAANDLAFLLERSAALEPARTIAGHSALNATHRLRGGECQKAQIFCLILQLSWKFAG
jgi:hypothetical protein